MHPGPHRANELLGLAILKLAPRQLSDQMTIRSKIRDDSQHFDIHPSGSRGSL